MTTRRDFLARTLGGSSLLAVGSVVPEFLANTALAADKQEKGKDTILVVVELTGGNDGLNTVAPFADDLYQKARPTIAISKKEALKLDDYCGLHPRMQEMKRLYDEKRLAVVRGVGYPNPDRSHFESMDIWQLADPKRAQTTGWLARAIPGMTIKDAGVPGMYFGDERLPVAMQGADGGVISLADRASFRLQLTGHEKQRKNLIEDLNADATGPAADLAAFVRKRQLQTYTSLQKIEEALNEAGAPQPNPDVRNFRPGPAGGDDLKSLGGRLQLVARLVQKGLGTRIYYTQLGGFDTHSGQATMHADLLGNLSSAVGNFLNALGEHADRVAVMTYSEFGRRVRENGSRGTDHGSGSCMFVAGNKVVGGLVGRHPSLSDLTDGDLKYHTDFRRVYATLLDDWLGVESRGVLGDKFEKLTLIDHKKKAPEGAGAPPSTLPPRELGSQVETVPPTLPKQ
ncbi:MAG TPA: DUF1501 domain-containing protein [Gemmata sp.]|nr:DUF1501 domain-containing protein [Gemmata sp.]